MNGQKWLEINSKEFKGMTDEQKSREITKRLRERGFDLTKHIHMTDRKGIYRYIQNYLIKE